MLAEEIGPEMKTLDYLSEYLDQIKSIISFNYSRNEADCIHSTFYYELITSTVSSTLNRLAEIANLTVPDLSHYNASSTQKNLMDLDAVIALSKVYWVPENSLVRLRDLPSSDIRTKALVTVSVLRQQCSRKFSSRCRESDN